MKTFDDLTLSDSLTKAIKEVGYTAPTPVQAQTLPILLGEPTDFIGLAATGTGKTAAFGIPLLEKLDPKKRAVQALILCPTRELSLQVAGQINLLGKYLGVKALAIYGGSGYEEQLRGLAQGAQVVIGTPGRLIDHLERGTLKLPNVKIVVLDEADEMISMGFRDEMEIILEKTPREKSNIWLFSATMSPSVRRVADHFLKNPQQVQVNAGEMLSATVEQSYFLTNEKSKPEVLCKLIDASEDFYGLVFCQTKVLVIDLNQYLSSHGYRASCLHGDMSQRDREIAMKQFRDKKVKVLVCTDVAARGLDVPDVSHVINYSIPRELPSYVHRIGRTARSGKTGHAISFVTPSHRHLLGKIERMTKSRIVEGVLPTRKEIGAKKVAAVLNTFNTQKSYARAIEIMDDHWKKAIASMSNEEIAGRFLAMMFPLIFAETQRPAMDRTASTSNKDLSGGQSNSRERSYDRDRSLRQRNEYRTEDRSFDRSAAKSDLKEKKQDRPRAPWNNVNNKRGEDGNYKPRRRSRSR